MFHVRTAKQGRAALFLLLSLTIPAGLPAPVEAHSGNGRVFPIAELTDEMLERIRLDDGTVDEWYGLVGEPTLTLLDFIDEWTGNPPDPSDFDFRIWLAWHDEPARLYLAFVASDDVYRNDHDYSSDDFLNRMISDIRNYRADYFLDGLLLPADPAGPGDSAVEPVSWGRIKASLELK